MFRAKEFMRSSAPFLKVAGIVAVLAGALYVSSALAAPPAAIGLTKISGSVDKTVTQLSTILIDICLIAGIGFIMSSFFKFHQHKQNPQQVQMSQGVSLLLIGCGLTLVPILIPTASVAVLGSTAAKPAQVGGTDIKELIGGK